MLRSMRRLEGGDVTQKSELPALSCEPHIISLPPKTLAKSNKPPGFQLWIVCRQAYNHTLETGVVLKRVCQHWYVVGVTCFGYLGMST